MKWFDDPYCLQMPTRRFQIQMALYAQHLATGSTLMCLAIKVNTIKLYVRQCVSFFMLFNRWETNPLMVPGTTTYFKELKGLYDELQRWEALPNRREPFTVEMLNAMHEGTFGHHDHASLFCCCRDWFGSGMYTGYRRTEFCQDSSRTTAMLDIFGNTKAFCLGDVTWQLRDGKRLIGAACLDYSRLDISKGWLCWRTQKNGANGEIRMFTQPDADNYSWIKFMYSIVRRFVALCGSTDFTTHLSVYRAASGVTHLLTAVDVERTMRQVAAKVYNLEPTTKTGKEALQLWSCHSLRVGACVLLHTMNFTAPQIKWLLRWKSDAFMVYLRNIANLSDKHCYASNMAAQGSQIIPFSINDDGEQPNVL